MSDVSHITEERKRLIRDARYLLNKAGLVEVSVDEFRKLTAVKGIPTVFAIWPEETR